MTATRRTDPDPRVLDDEALLEAFRSASTRPARDAAFAELVDRYERRVYAICYRYFGDHADAEDATQDTFVSLARRADSFRGDSALSTWIYRVATNACHDLARKRARRPQTPVGDVAEAFGDDERLAADDVLAGRELAHEIQAALLTLDDLSRTLIILCAIEGRDYAEVSAALDLPIGTIKSRVHRARAKLAEVLAPVLDGDGDGDGDDRSPTPRRLSSADGPTSAQPRGPPRDGS